MREIADGTLSARLGKKMSRFDDESQRWFLSVPRDQLGAALWHAEKNSVSESELLETIQRLEKQLQNAYERLEGWRLSHANDTRPQNGL